MDTTSTNPDTSANLHPKEGSTLYYSLLFAEPAARTRAMQTLQLVKAISTTLHDVSEPTVAEKKIHWWHEELARLAKRSARHPACEAVQEYLNSKNSANACLSILSAAANERYTPLATQTALNEMITADYSARLTLVEMALGNNEHIHKNQANTDNATALGLGQLHRLSTLVERLQHGYAVFSDEQFAQHNVTPESMLENQPQSDALLHSVVDQTSTTLKQALTEQNHASDAMHASLPVRTMTQLRLSQVNLWKKRKPDLLREYITVTPVRKFFIAYRCKRRFA